jgi:hypothetical protein
MKDLLEGVGLQEPPIIDTLRAGRASGSGDRMAVAAVSRSRDALGRFRRSIDDLYQEFGRLRAMRSDAASRLCVIDLYLDSVAMLLREIEDGANRR